MRCDEEPSTRILRCYIYSGGFINKQPERQSAMKNQALVS